MGGVISVLRIFSKRVGASASMSKSGFPEEASAPIYPGEDLHQPPPPYSPYPAQQPYPGQPVAQPLVAQPPQQVVIQQVPAQQQRIVYVMPMGSTPAGQCPSCQNGVVVRNYITLCGVLWSIILFPIGLLCLFCCYEERCSACGAKK